MAISCLCGQEQQVRDCSPSSISTDSNPHLHTLIRALHYIQEQTILFWQNIAMQTIYSDCYYHFDINYDFVRAW